MERTMYEVLEELETDFKDLQMFIDAVQSKKDKELKIITKQIIHEYLIPHLKELSELLDY